MPWSGSNAVSDRFLQTKTIDLKKTYYHGTAPHNLPSIKEQGLLQESHCIQNWQCKRAIWVSNSVQEAYQFGNFARRKRIRQDINFPEYSQDEIISEDQLEELGALEKDYERRLRSSDNVLLRVTIPENCERGFTLTRIGRKPREVDSFEVVGCSIPPSMIEVCVIPQASVEVDLLRYCKNKWLTAEGCRARAQTGT